MENQEERATMNDKSETTGSAQSAVGICCRNSAAMLQLADQSGDMPTSQRFTVCKANKGQAGLLWTAACLADEMLAALVLANDALTKATNGDEYGEYSDQFDLIKAVIAKAKGAA